MAIEKIMILGNWELCLTILNALFPQEKRQGTPRYQVTVLTYLSQTLSLPPHVKASDVQHKRSGYSSASLQSVMTGQDLVVSTMSGGDVEQQIRIINAAIAAGVRRFIPDEFSHDSMNKQIQARIPKDAGRAKVIAHLRSMREDYPYFEWTAIATGYTLDTQLISGNMGFDLEWHSATIHGIGTEAFAASSLERVGRVVERVISHWDEVRNQYIYAAGVITSANEVLRSTEKTTGREFTVGNHDVQECVAEGEKRIEKGFPDSGMFLLERSVLYDEQLDASRPFRNRNSNYVLGLKSESVETIVRTAYDDFKHYGKPGCGCSA
ncbi:hypothetical protein J4E90_010971 [Alternaria incomplexa]|uniref:uncharacterized protein n=1 Tax=Alternaria incomplexa TaxID=1187928 RepID=UPI00221FF661|nr:uncharacterized protein J4E90_010971 [Alternaria incomplexa]XP_051305690.1 uncharacterized protein J4E86_001535 [Alternaria arbusti]KAI4906012.1 hypothetical protein J4E90_010971 [Alternaria incomplexa]KAI4959917.1 hypothetical protein J4E86_001535 [Alternaria arbusti]